MYELKEREVKSIECIDGVNDFIGTEWHNGEGIDFVLVDEKNVSLHIDEIRAIAKIAFAMGFLEVN